MYKILLVDDESGVRQGIRERIAWNEYGFDCVGDCENGMEALDAAELLEPDVVLTDINMPFMDGLELTRNLAERLPKTKVLILTGFDDFEYAQQAVKLRVKDFLLKPVTAQELADVLQKLKAELDEEKERRENLDRLQKQLLESMPVLKERFLERMVTVRISPNEVKERMAYFRLPLSGPEYVVFAVDVDHLGQSRPDADRELLRFAMYNIAQEILSGQDESAVFRSREEKVVCILSGNPEARIYVKAQTLAEEIRHSVETYLRFTVTVGIGRPVTGMENIRQSYLSAVSALDYRLLLGMNRVISIMDLEGRRSLTAETTGNWEKELIVGIKTGTHEEVDRAIESIIRQLKSAVPSIEQCYIRIQKLVVSLLNALDELGGSEEQLFGGETVNPLTEIYCFKTLDEIEIWLKERCGQAIRLFMERRNDLARLQMLKAESYIKNNFADHDLSLKTVCDFVHMSNSYFSAVFKAHTGKTFVEYITAIRIEKAKELIKFSDLKNYEIAAKAGYADPHYFSVLFKKMTGHTPTEYRMKTAAEQG